LLFPTRPDLGALLQKTSGNHCWIWLVQSNVRRQTGGKDPLWNQIDRRLDCQKLVLRQISKAEHVGDTAAGGSFHYLSLIRVGE
jgi:hypothetical protein